MNISTEPSLTFIVFKEQQCKEEKDYSSKIESHSLNKEDKTDVSKKNKATVKRVQPKNKSSKGSIVKRKNKI